MRATDLERFRGREVRLLLPGGEIEGRIGEMVSEGLVSVLGPIGITLVQVESIVAVTELERRRLEEGQIGSSIE